MKIALRVLASVGALVVVAVGAALVVLATLDPNEYRTEITSQVKSATGRELIINGNLAVGISLIPTIVANNVSFANAPWGSRPEMASLRRLEANLQILPLLSGEIRIGRIVLVEPDILLEVGADGRANWEFSGASDSSEPATIPVVQAVSIDRGKVRYLDHKAKQDLSLALDRVRIDETGANKRLKFDIAGAYNGSPFELRGMADSLARLAADADDYAVEVDATAFAATARLKGTVGKLLSAPTLGVDLTLAGKDLNATLTGVSAIMPGLDASAVTALGGFEIAVKANGPAAAPVVETLRFAIGTTDALKLEGTGHGKGDTYTLDRLSARIKGSDLGGTLTAKTGGKVPEITADLEATHFDLADLKTVLPKSEPPAAPPGPAQKSTATPTRGDGRVFPADPLPLDGLKVVNATVTLKAGRLVVEGMPIDGVDAKIALKNGRLVLDPFAATFAEGRLGGRTVIDSAVQAPSVETNLTADKLNIGQLLKERGLTDQLTDQLTGRMSATVNARGSGASVRAIMASLTGTTEVVMAEGRIASRYVEVLAADLFKQIMPTNHAADTKINCLVSRFDIKQGIATSTGLLFDTERMTVAGAGTIDLRQERLNLTVNPEPKDASLVSLAVPLQVSGTFASPSVAPTTESVVKSVAGLALFGLTPLGALAALSKLGTGDQNPCLAALDRKSPPSATPPGVQQRQPQPQQQQPTNPVDNITKGVQDKFRSIFGSGK